MKTYTKENTGNTTYFLKEKTQANSATKETTPVVVAKRLTILLKLLPEKLKPKLNYNTTVINTKRKCKQITKNKTM
jgi:hypothetical protein